MAAAVSTAVTNKSHLSSALDKPFTTPSQKLLSLAVKTLPKPYHHHHRTLITAASKNPLTDVVSSKPIPDGRSFDSYFHDDDDKPREECGVVGIYGDSEASRLCYLALHALQHRGQEGAGIVCVNDNVLKSITGVGLVSDVFSESKLDQLPGDLAIGHVRSVYESRRAFGEILATEAPVECDVVIAVPDSGVVAALGYAAKAGVPFQQGLIRSHYVGRTFIEPSQKIRDFGVKLKLSPVRAVLEGKRVVVVDDSIVRGTTSSKIVRLLKEAGAKEVHMRIASPPIIASCYYGVDTPSSEELISNRMSVEEIREYIGSDSLAFLPIESLNKLLGSDSKSYCYACFSGNYPVEPTGKVKRIGDFMDDGLSGDMDSIDGGWLPGSSKVQKKIILNEVRTS